MSLTTTLNLAIDANYQKALDLSTVSDHLAKVFTLSLPDGIGSGQANKLFHDVRTLANSANESLDLAGVLTDAFGDILTLAKVKVLIIKNRDTVQTLSVGGAASLGWAAPFGDATDILKIAPGALAVLVWDPAGVAVTAGTGDLLKIANGAAGNAADYEIIIIGSTAA
jgi:hypothetical protein